MGCDENKYLVAYECSSDGGLFHTGGSQLINRASASGITDEEWGSYYATAAQEVGGVKCMYTGGMFQGETTISVKVYCKRHTSMDTAGVRIRKKVQGVEVCTSDEIPPAKIEISCPVGKTLTYFTCWMGGYTNLVRVDSGINYSEFMLAESFNPKTDENNKFTVACYFKARKLGGGCYGNAEVGIKAR